MNLMSLPCLLAALVCVPAGADGAAGAGNFAELAGFAYSVKADLTYSIASNLELKLDVYQPRGARGKVPVVVYFHGGGWVEGRRHASSLLVLPYLAQGWAVVNVDYRLARTAPAPAAAEDARCALHWVHRMADEFGFDRDAIVTAGDSAGGHLALLAAMLPPGSALERGCRAPDAMRWNGQPRPVPRVAAVINWFGVTDVGALLDGLDARNFAVEWFGALAGRERLAQDLSPLRHVRAGGPAVVSVHGERDGVVPYRHATALHAELARVGVANELVSIAGAGHGDFTPDQAVRAHERIRYFLGGLGIAARPLMPLQPTP